MSKEQTMSSRRSFGFIASLVLCAAALSFCGHAKTGETTQTPPATPPAKAANDTANTTQPNAPEPETYDPASATGAVKGIPAPTNTAPIEAVANFFVDLPGFDLTPLEKHQREKFLHRVNSELCTCGCKNDTLAHCLVNDPKCPAVKNLVQNVYDEVKSGR
jgi:hypothetical protein